MADVSKIVPEDTLRVLLPAHKIPHQALVSKRAGETPYTLVHNLTVYPAKDRGAAKVVDPMIIEGFFLVGGFGSISQVGQDQLLLWCVTAEALMDYFHVLFAPEEQ